MLGGVMSESPLLDSLPDLFPESTMIESIIEKEMLDLRDLFEEYSHIKHINISDLKVGGLRPSITIGIVQECGQDGIRRLTKAFRGEIHNVYKPHPMKFNVDQSIRKKSKKDTISEKIIIENFLKNALEDQEICRIVGVESPDIDKMVQYGTKALQNMKE